MKTEHNLINNDVKTAKQILNQPKGHLKTSEMGFSWFKYGLPVWSSW